MNITSFAGAKDARNYVLSQFPIMATQMLGQVQPDKPNYYEGENPIFVCTGDRNDPTMEFEICPYETEYEGNPVFGISLSIPNINSAIDYIIGINDKGLLDESTVQIAYHADALGKDCMADNPQEFQRRVMKFTFIESYVRSWLQGIIDKCRGWSPYANAEEYMRAMQSDNPPPTTPKRFF